MPVPPSSQQSFAAISGVVTDADGAAVPRAHVSLSFPAAIGFGVETVTSSTGIFSFDRLAAAGVFVVTVTAQGFAAAQSSGTLHPGDSVQLPDLVLTAAASDSISVTAGTQGLAAAELRL